MLRVTNRKLVIVIDVVIEADEHLLTLDVVVEIVNGTNFATEVCAHKVSEILNIGIEYARHTSLCPWAVSYPG